jgi:hypothetical protein
VENTENGGCKPIRRYRLIQSPHRCDGFERSNLGFKTSSNTSIILTFIFKNLLVSLSSDSSFSMWKTASQKDYTQWMNEEKYTAGLIKTVSKKPENSQFGPNPTTSCFSKHDNNLLCLGFNDSSLSVYDINKVLLLVFDLSGQIFAEC